MTQLFPEIIGIDGCLAGWCAVININNTWKINVFGSLEELVNNYPRATHYLIDMPMGLSDANCSRDLDEEMRKKLKPRHSTVFQAPCREVLAMNSYNKANELNREILGKGLSIQSWNLVPKIRELDQLLQTHPGFRDRFYESSPELCFAGLNKGNPLLEKKSQRIGMEKRIRILSSYPNFVINSINTTLTRYNRKQVKIDDILDAWVLCQTGVLGYENGFEIIENEETKRDSCGIPMRIAYFIEN